MRTSIARFLSVPLAAAVCAAAFAASPAGASATAAKAAPSNDVIAVKVPMKVTGFDPAVAREYGHPAAVPDNQVNGNCGYSYYYLAKRTAKTWTFWTGFYSSKGAAVDYSWTTQVWGPAKYHTTDSFSGSLYFHAAWSSKYKRFHSIGRHGSYLGRVTSGVVVTVLGYVCHPVGPWDRKNF